MTGTSPLLGFYFFLFFNSFFTWAPTSHPTLISHTSTNPTRDAQFRAFRTHTLSCKRPTPFAVVLQKSAESCRFQHFPVVVSLSMIPTEKIIFLVIHQCPNNYFFFFFLLCLFLRRSPFFYIITHRPNLQTRKTSSTPSDGSFFVFISFLYIYIYLLVYILAVCIYALTHKVIDYYLLSCSGFLFILD